MMLLCTENDAHPQSGCRVVNSGGRKKLQIEWAIITLVIK